MSRNALWRRHVRVVAGLAVGAMAVAGCGGDDDDANTASLGEPVALGEQLYVNRCASCHGTDLRGTELGPSHLSIVYEPGHHPDDAFRAAVEQGVTAHHWEFGDMAPIAGLADDELDAIIAFVRSAQEREGFEPYPPE